jgi:hypothetical protein
VTKTGLCLTALGALIASAASAQGPAPAAFKVISPIFGQLVTFSMPVNFVVVAENSNGPNYIREAVLKGETVKSWTQMITVTGAKGLVSNPKATSKATSKANPKTTPETFAGSIVGGFRSACPDSFAAQGFGPTRFGDQDAYVAVASCGSVGTDRHGETALIVAVKGRDDYYTLQWAERTQAAGKPAIDEAKWLGRLRQLQPIRFCLIVPGEAAPYPSCAVKG